MNRKQHNHWMLCKMPVIVGASICVWLILNDLSIFGWMVGLTGFAITTIMENAGKVHSDGCGNGGNNWDA
jgi:hypothetical protein